MISILYCIFHSNWCKCLIILIPIISYACALKHTQCGKECLAKSVWGEDPSSIQKCQELVYICESFQMFVDCFWDYSLDIKDRLTKLSTFAHVILFIYRKNSNNFLPSVLHFDLMSFVVAAFTLVNMHQKYFPTNKFYLFLLGDDRLELLFSNIRTIQHGLSLDCIQLQDRIESALTIEKVFLKYSDWRSTSRRISEGDYINAEMISGSCDVRSLSLTLLWTKGANDAITFLEKLDPSLVGTINWNELHSQNINIVEPFGPNAPKIYTDDEPTNSSHESSAPDAQSSLNNVFSSPVSSVGQGIIGMHEDVVDSSILSQQLEDYVDEASASASYFNPYIIDKQGIRLHKSTLCNTHINNINGIFTRSNDRLRAISGQDKHSSSSKRFKSSVSSSSISSSSSVSSSSMVCGCNIHDADESFVYINETLVALAVQSNNQISPVIARLVAIIPVDGKQLSSVCCSSLNRTSSNIKLKVVPLKFVSVGKRLLWSGEASPTVLKVDSNSVVIMGSTIYYTNGRSDQSLPSNDDMVDENIEQEAEDLTQSVNFPCPTYSISISELNNVLYHNVENDSDATKLLRGKGSVVPVFQAIWFPYQAVDSLTSSRKKTQKIECAICTYSCNIKDMRLHVSAHILAGHLAPGK